MYHFHLNLLPARIGRLKSLIEGMNKTFGQKRLFDGECSEKSAKAS